APSLTIRYGETVGCPSGTGLTLLLIWPLLIGSGGERRLSLLPRAPPPACGIAPRFSLRSIAPLLTGSGGERRLSPLPRAPPPACGIAPRFSSLCGMLPRPGRLTRQKGGARCEDSCGSSVWFSPSR